MSGLTGDAVSLESGATFCVLDPGWMAVFVFSSGSRLLFKVCCQVFMSLFCPRIVVVMNANEMRPRRRKKETTVHRVSFVSAV